MFKTTNKIKNMKVEEKIIHSSATESTIEKILVKDCGFLYKKILKKLLNIEILINLCIIIFVLFFSKIIIQCNANEYEFLIMIFSFIILLIICPIIIQTIYKEFFDYGVHFHKDGNIVHIKFNYMSLLGVGMDLFIAILFSAVFLFIISQNLNYINLFINWIIYDAYTFLLNNKSYILIIIALIYLIGDFIYLRKEDKYILDKK